MSTHISEFKKNKNKVILCKDINEAKIVGKHLWESINIDSWNPVNQDFPVICWYSENSTSFNPIRSLTKHQTIYYFNEVNFEDEFILPEKWCVKGTKDKVVQKFFLIYKDNTIGDFVRHPSYENWYFYSEQLDNLEYASKKIKSDFTEITFEQFSKYVLKNNYNYLIEFLKKLKL